MSNIRDDLRYKIYDSISNYSELKIDVIADKITEVALKDFNNVTTYTDISVTQTYQYHSQTKKSKLALRIALTNQNNKRVETEISVILNNFCYNKKGE